ncbi:MAG: hypothetical protein H7Y02_02900 [Candidatus Obscuribacterales bacterium]|nr:hypothetical protein [Steroidobacteraceae bacterium]
MSAVRLESQPAMQESVTPDPALQAIVAHNGPVLLDLDETLYLRNSTEDFIDSARPATLALIAMRLLDAIKPWRWTGGDKTRDVWRVRCILALFPWTKDLWRKRVATLAIDAANAPLISAVKMRVGAVNAHATVITTLGFQSVVAPLVAALGLAQLRIVAARSSTFADRRDGKLRMVVNALGNETVRRALVLTDSNEDEALLNACAVPLQVIWPNAKFRPALSDLYLPGQYMTQVKRPGERYIARGILQEDFALWVLGSISLASQPISHVLGLLFLLVSFWAVYEQGYVDNDRIAARYEHDPKLSDEFRSTPAATPRWAPWIWALGSGAIAVLLLRSSTGAEAYDFLKWLAVLVATYGGFAFYNRFDKATRIWCYSGLQFARGAAFVALVPITLIGAIAVGAHVLAKWVPYYIYRLGGKDWPSASHFVTRLLFFMILTVLVGLASGFSAIWGWSFAALLAWNVFRARHELSATLAAAKRLDTPPR